MGVVGVYPVFNLLWWLGMFRNGQEWLRWFVGWDGWGAQDWKVAEKVEVVVGHCECLI